MKTSDLFNYQTEAMRLLNNSYEKDKLVHAYLLDGDKGSGTVDAAIYMAKKLICKSEEKPCNTCNDCKRVDSHTHLNFLYIEPTNDSIKKEQIENLIHEFSMSSMEGNTKVYASIYNPDQDETKLLPIETDKEWKIIETILEELQNEPTNGEGEN